MYIHKLLNVSVPQSLCKWYLNIYELVRIYKFNIDTCRLCLPQKYSVSYFIILVRYFIWSPILSLIIKEKHRYPGIFLLSVTLVHLQLKINRYLKQRFCYSYDKTVESRQN